MATVTNTVQGLNETIGLLKQILIAVSDKDKAASKDGGGKDVQAKDISSSAIILGKIDKNSSDNIKNVILAFEPLEKMNDDIGDKAKKVADAIKVLSSEDIVNGLECYNNITPKIVNNVTEVIYSLVEALQKMSDKIDIKKLTTFSESIKVIVDSIKKLTMVVYLMAGLILVSALVGVIAIFAWKYILIGFASIVATIGVVIGVSFLIKLVSQLSEQIINNIKSVTSIIYEMASIVFLSAAVGTIAITAWKHILIGFSTIVAIIMGVFLIIGIIKMVNAMLKIASFKFGGGTFLKHFLKEQVNSPMPSEVKDIIYVLAAIALIPIISAFVGLIATNYLGIVTIGFGAITAMLWGILALCKHLDTLKGTSKKGINTAYTIAILLLALAAVVLILVGVSAIIDNAGLSWESLILSVVMMMSLMLTVALLLKLVGTIKPSTKSIIAMVIIVAIMAVLALLMHSIVDLTNKVAEAGGWGNIFITLAAMAGFVLGITALLLAIGALMLIPPLPAILGIGAAVVAGVSAVVILVAVAIKKIVEAYKECESVGLENLPGIGISMSNALLGFVTNVINGLKDISLKTMAKISIMMLPIQLIINTTSKFIKMLSSFSSDGCGPDELRPIHYNEKTGEYKVGDKINLVNAAIAISSSFAKFITTLYEGMKDFKGADTIKEISKMNLLPILDSCSSFVKMVSSIVGSSESNKLFYYMTDKDGNFMTDKDGNYITREVDLVNAAITIANGFSTFITTLSSQFKQIKGLGKLEDISEMNLTSIIDSTVKFVEMVSNMTDVTPEQAQNGVIKIYERDKNGNYIFDEKHIKTINLKQAGIAMGKGIGGFLLGLTSGLSKISDLEDFADSFGKITNSFEKVTNSIFKIDDEKSKKLKEYTDAINKFAEAVSKVSESIDTLNGKQIDLKLDQLRDSLNMKIGADINVNTNNNVASKHSNNSNNGNNNIINSSGGNISIDMNAISNAIVEGFKKIDIIRVELDNTNKYQGQIYVE